MPQTAVEMGRHAEAMAAAFLSLCGYRVLERNFRHGRLEIDLIVTKGNVLAVVEVKFRRKRRMGGVCWSVSPAKQRDVETAAVGYVRMKDLRGVRIRFDVVTLEPTREPGVALIIRHLPDAFSASGRYRL